MIRPCPEIEGSKYVSAGNGWNSFVDLSVIGRISTSETGGSRNIRFCGRVGVLFMSEPMLARSVICMPRSACA